MAGSTKRATVRAVLAGIVLCTVAAVTPKPAEGQAAVTAITGLEKVQSVVVTNSVSPKEGVAACPGTKRVVGGGGWVFATTGGDHPERLALTRLEPTGDVNPGNPNDNRDGYIAAAAETQPTTPGGGTTDNWWVQAYALCADAASVPGWELEAAFTDTLITDRQEMAVGCDPGEGKTVIGTGARIAVFFQGEVVLQVARASGPGDITRAQGHTDADGYTGSWWLGAYAICANPPPGYQVVTGQSNEVGSESEKDANVSCPVGKQLLSTGAAITNIAPGHVSLQQSFPSGRRTDAFAVENAPFSGPWDFIIARGICAT